MRWHNRLKVNQLNHSNIHTLQYTLPALRAWLNVIQQQSGSVFLESAGDIDANNRYSIYAWAPKYVVETRDQKTTVFQDEKIVESTNQNPLTVVEDFLKSLTVIESDLPFTNGALGYWDYELANCFDKVNRHPDGDINMANMYVGIYDQALILDRQHSTLYFVSQSDDHLSRAQAIQQQLLTPVLNIESFKLTSDWQANMSKSEYQLKFEQVQQHLLAGDCYQINLAQRFSANYQGDEYQAYLKLRQANQAPFSGFIRCNDGAVLSLSPERFLQVKDGHIETKPIKGTLPRSSNPQQDQLNATTLKNSAKDQAENLMIVDLLRNDVSKVAIPGSVEVPKLFDIESYPAVHHLVSTITAKLQPPYTSLDLLRGAFPGGSITGAPKISAMNIIHQLEPHRRSVYCGAIGYIDANGNMDTNITIRTLVCNQGQIHCWAGGGLVADSTWQSEYQETLDKVNKILPILAGTE